jgi:ADP-ribose pyrophosphatase YjhB (NUDIX family)
MCTSEDRETNNECPRCKDTKKVNCLRCGGGGITPRIDLLECSNPCLFCKEGKVTCPTCEDPERKARLIADMARHKPTSGKNKLGITRLFTGGLTLYVEGTIRPEMRGGKRLSSAVYKEVLDNLIAVCVDTMVVNMKKETFSLLKRVSKPMQGLWCVGGRRDKCEIPVEAMCRKFKDETGLDINPGRFIFIALEEHIWQDRQQAPQHHGSHSIAHQFIVELTPDELESAAKHLETKEFDSEFGLQEYNRARLIEEDVHTMIIDLYDKVFPIK